MIHDLRYALRALIHRPGFAFAAILSIALGIGANTAIFSFADGLLLRPLPIRDASRLVTLRELTPAGTYGSISWSDYLDFRDHDRSLNGLVAYEPASIGFAPDAQTQPQLKSGLLVSRNFFKVLGVEPHLGRGFNQADDFVVVLGHDFWQSEWNGDRSVIGKRIRVNGVEVLVIGVAPEAFTGMDQYSRPALFLPASMGPLLLSNSELLTNRSNRSFTVKARLRDGVSLEAANAEVASLAKSLERANPATNRAFGAAIRTEMQSRLDLGTEIRDVLSLLFGLVFVVLAIACANVANLMLGRGRSRSREIAVRLAIGASRYRVVRQLMAESLLIALAGGAAGLLIARLFVGFASSSIQMPGDIPMQLSFQIDTRVLWFTFLISICSAILFGLMPALQATKTDLIPALKTGEADQARRRLLGRNALVITQIAGSLVLLVVATQLVRGTGRQLAENPGFRRDHALVMSFDPSLARYSPAQTAQFYKLLAERARVMTGVTSASLASAVPMSINNQRMETVIPESYQFLRGQDHVSVGAATVDEAYFDTLGVPVVRGRGFSPTDNMNAPLVGIVNDAFARHYFAGDPLGKRLRLKGQSDLWVEVVGITSTGKYYSLMEPPTEFLYLPLKQHPMSQMTLIARTKGDPVALATPLREMVRSMDSNLPVFSVRTLMDFFEQREAKTFGFIVGTVSSMGLLGLALALVGLYAVVSYQVAGRTREIGIRMAIGADRFKVMTMILKQAVGVSVTGVAIGVAFSMAASRALGSNLLVGAADPLLFTMVAAGLLVTTFMAAVIPARRAAHVDPLTALRAD